MIGNTLSHYKIISKLGQGGQGEVCLAEDSRLDRKVALKILPEHLSERADLRERFEREARAVSSLNHPHICTLHDIGEQDGIHFLVMEHLEGETLAARLEKGALPLEQTLEYAIQIADALDKAHRQGVVHRDLKPGNIMLVKSGAKLLDFGLAKLKATEATEENLSNLPTEQANLTAEGTILGTLQYMAPEQLEGKDTDSRTDIFAFGAVVYEMATGKKAFEGSSQASLIAAIMGQEPRPMSELQPMTPQLLDWVVRRCLAKQPDERWQAASDVMAGLRQATEVGTTMDSLPAVAAPAVWKRAVPWSIVAVLAIITAVMSWSDSPVRSPGSTTPRRVTIDLAEGVTLPKGQGPAISTSPDGQTLVYVGESGSGRQLYRRNMNQFASTPIPGTEGAFTPTISPDGDAVVFFKPVSQEYQRVSLSGGEPFPVCRTCDGASWADDGHIYFRRADDGSLSRVPELGGPEEFVLEPMPDQGLRVLRNPVVLPGGRAVLVEVGQLGEFAGVAVVDIESKKIVEISADGSSPIYSPTGHILFPRRNTLFAVPFDLDRLEVAGSEVAVLQGIRVENGGALQADVSANGLLVYVPANGAIGTELVWVDRQGAILERAYEERRVFYGPRISPDGQRVAVQINDDAHSGIWILDIGAGTLRMLATPADATSPLWTDDGKRVAFGSGFPGAYLIQWAPADGSGEVETLIQSNHPIVPEAFSRDGTQLVFREDSLNPSLFVGELADEGSRAPFLATEASESSATLSHNGKWLAYVSDSSGAPEVFVRPFPGPGGETLVSTGGGSSPVWGPDDTELFYLSRDDSQMMVASLKIEPFLVLGKARLLDTAPFWSVTYRAHYDVHPDSQRFLMLAESENESRPSINVVLNWFEELNRLVPTDN